MQHYDALLFRLIVIQEYRSSVQVKILFLQQELALASTIQLQINQCWYKGESKRTAILFVTKKLRLPLNKLYIKIKLHVRGSHCHFST